MHFLKRIFKIFGSILFVGFVIMYTLFYIFTAPKSDESILDKFKDVAIKPVISKEIFNDFEFRKLTLKTHDSLPTFVFVHGAIGSCIDFIDYMKDEKLSKKANFVSYDRIGYSYKDKNKVQESIALEAKMVQHITKNIPKQKTILVGYSYGGPIALADTTNYKKLILLAPAVYSKVEPMPWLLNIYKWKWTRWMVPKIWKQASKEKISHRKDLQNFEDRWSLNPNKIISIHGDEDDIVPYTNSLFLMKQFSKSQFEFIRIPNAGHGLIWSDFDFIKQQFLKQLY